MNWYKRQLKIAKLPTERRVPHNKINFSDDDLKIIKDLLDGGETFKEIGELFGVSRSVINRLNDKYKWREKRVFDDPSSYIDRVVELHNKGLSYNGIRKELNNEISLNQVRNILERKGLVPPIQRKSKEEYEKTKKERSVKDEQIARMYLAPPKGKGMTMLDIAKYYGHNSHTAIKKSLIRSGLKDKIRTKDESAELSGGKERHREKMKNWWKEHGEEHMEKLMPIFQSPEYRKMKSEQSQKWWDENAWAKEYMSDVQKERWEEIGSFENYIYMMDSREKALRLVKGFIGSKLGKEKSVEQRQQIFNMYGKYMKIIEDYTFPDEVQQPQPV